MKCYLLLKFNSSSQNFLFLSCISNFHCLKFRNVAVLVTSLCQLNSECDHILLFVNRGGMFPWKDLQLACVSMCGHGWWMGISWVCILHHHPPKKIFFYIQRMMVYDSSLSYFKCPQRIVWWPLLSLFAVRLQHPGLIQHPAHR